MMKADPNGRVYPRPLPCWNCWLESYRKHECLSLASAYCLFSGRGLGDGSITRPEESYLVWCVWVWSWKLTEKAKAH